MGDPDPKVVGSRKTRLYQVFLESRRWERRIGKPNECIGFAETKKIVRFSSFAISH
jgi:hypothetical protein